MTKNLPTAITELEPSERFCHHCDKALKGKFRWLELNCQTGQWSDRGDIPADQSQGWFPIGTTCAKTLLNRS